MEQLIAQHAWIVGAYLRNFAQSTVFRAKDTLENIENHQFPLGIALAKRPVIMNKHHISAWALVVAGFAVGVMTGVAGTTHGAPSAPPQPTTLAEVFGAQERTQIIDAAAECGVYGLPGSPATLVLRTDAQGAPMSASVESDIFGGDETEECILKGISASKSVERTHRILLPTYFPDKNESIVANR